MRSRIGACLCLAAVLVAGGCTWGKRPVDRTAYVRKNLDAIAFLHHPSQDRSVRHIAQREPFGDEEVVVAYVTRIEQPVPGDLDPFTYFGKQFADHGWSVGCIETQLTEGAFARAVSAANEESFARVEAGDAMVAISIDHRGAHSGNGTAQDQAWHCSIPEP